MILDKSSTSLYFSSFTVLKGFCEKHSEMIWIPNINTPSQAMDTLTQLIQTFINRLLPCPRVSSILFCLTPSQYTLVCQILTLCLDFLTIPMSLSHPAADITLSLARLRSSTPRGDCSQPDFGLSYKVTRLAPALGLYSGCRLATTGPIPCPWPGKGLWKVSQKLLCLYSASSTGKESTCIAGDPGLIPG